MNRSRAGAGGFAGRLALVTSTMVLAAATSAVAAPDIEASWEMNEPAEATVMVDSGPNGFDTPVDQSGLDTGYLFDGALSYHWPRRAPELPPASPERVIVVPDNDNLDPMDDVYVVELRYRTREKFGNIAQKGQATTVGGQWKIQNPQGRPSCLFKGSIQRGAVRSRVALNDNQWHVLRCVRTPTAVEMWVDGARVGRKLGATGRINNSFPLTIGGKLACDQVRVTCDYFSGDIDYLRVSRGL